MRYTVNGIVLPDYLKGARVLPLPLWGPPRETLWGEHPHQVSRSKNNWVRLEIIITFCSFTGTAAPANMPVSDFQQLQ